MIDVKKKNVYKSDLNVIQRWINDFFFVYGKKINLNNKNIDKLKFIISDNIRVGLKFKSIFFICPFAIFNKRYLIYEKIEKILKEKINTNSKSFYNQFLKKNILYSNLNIKLSKSKIHIKKILILGPKKRNDRIIKKLKKCFIIINKNSKFNLDYIKKNKVDFIISSGYPFKIKDDIVNYLNNKIINLHATFLPWGKGIGTTFFSIILRQPTGFSIHLIDKNFDTGAILLRKNFKFFNNDTTRTFYKKILRELEKIFLKNFKFILYYNLKNYKQKKFKIRPPYFSRNDFEKIIELLPRGYDTKILDLIKLSNIFHNNINFINYFNK